MNRRIILIVSLLLAITYANALTCGTYNTPQSGTLVMSLSNETNAHGELPSESNYGWYVYCENASYTLGTSCTGAELLNLSNATNAHATVNVSLGYSDQICLSVVETGIECTSVNGSLPVGYECVTTLSNGSNAHLSSCSSPYDIQVGCRFADDGFPTWTNNITNETASTPRYNEFIEMNVTLNDDLDLDSYTFSWNDSGWSNDSVVDISGTEYNVSVSKQVTRTRGDIVSWRVWFNDSAGNENVTDVFSFTVKNTAPSVPVLDELADETVTINRTPRFNWTASDIDSDPLTYNISIECLGGCSVDNRNATVSDPNYTPSELQYYSDDGYTYRWRVQACDDLDCSAYSSWNTFNLSSFVSIEFTQDTIDFAEINVGTTNSTETDDPAPFVLSNVGNVLVNVTYYADSSLYQRASLPSSFFRAKVRSGNYTTAQESYFQIPSVSSPQDLVRELTTGGNATIDLEVTVPLDEPPGIRNSTTIAVAVRS